MSQLVINNGSASNPQSIDLTQYMDPNEGAGMDLADPAFTNRVWSRSLLKHGATLALEQLVEKELTFPLRIGPIGGLAGAPTSLSATLQFVQNINMILETPGATATWQPVGASQPTTFDLLSGQFEIAYNYRAEQQKWTFGNLRLFTQPLGRTAAPRVYATASGVGPLLMISPYASSGAQAIGASTQAGVAGFGGQQQGASSGVFYWGSPSLAGDAPALLQISYVGPLPASAANYGVVPYAAVSLLPDPYYQPLVTAPELRFSQPGGAAALVAQQNSIASQSLLLRTPNSAAGVLAVFNPLQSASVGVEPTAAWAGGHRLLAIARASGHLGGGGTPTQPYMQLQTGGNVQYTTGVITVPIGPDFAPYDLGTVAFRASQAPQVVEVGMYVNGGATACGLELAGLVMLPERSTWFLAPTQIQPSQYGYPAGIAAQDALGAIASAPYTNTVLVDDVLGEQFVYWGQSQTFAPSPIGSIPSAGRITQFTRGLVPAPDPKDGLPIIAILGVNPGTSPSSAGIDFGLSSWSVGGASWTNPQNLRTMAQVNVLERFRYVVG